jgi:hypothetical protein
MPLPAIPIIGALGFAIVPIIVKVAISLGVGVVVFTGVSAASDAAFSYIVDQTNDLTADVLAFFAIMNLDKYITMIFGAYSAKLTIQGMTAAGTFNKWNFKGIPTE